MLPGPFGLGTPAKRQGRRRRGSDDWVETRNSDVKDDRGVCRRKLDASNRRPALRCAGDGRVAACRDLGSASAAALCCLRGRSAMVMDLMGS